MNLESLNISSDHCVFIDRDGVINKRIIGNYVKKIEEFKFLPGSIDTIVRFSKMFKHIFIVTNQQGVGKGLMTTDDLELIHNYMIGEIEAAGGRVDAIYYCPALKNTGNSCRKPEIGMALKAQQEFHDVDFNKSIMIGDGKSDMAFGKNAGMQTIFIDAQDGGVKPHNADIIYHRLGDIK